MNRSKQISRNPIIIATLLQLLFKSWKIEALDIDILVEKQPTTAILDTKEI